MTTPASPPRPERPPRGSRAPGDRSPSRSSSGHLPLRFNPTEYQLTKANTFAEIPIPGLESPPIQYVRGDSEKLSLEALVDTSDTLEDVRVRYVTGCAS